MTGLDLIVASLRLIGVAASEESLTSAQANDGLSSLNDLLDGWSNESLLTFPILREVLSFGSAGAKQTYTWGTSGDLNSARPMRVQKALIQLAGTSPVIELPIDLLNVEQYANVLLKTLTSTYPLYAYIDDAYPQRNINVWPVPTDTTNGLVLYSQKPLTQAVLTTPLSLPPGYQRALRYNLAIDLAPEYGRTASAEIIGIADQSKAEIKRNNKKPVYLQVDAAIRSNRGVYNWRTDGYER